VSALYTLLEAGDLRLEPFADRHIEPLRTACARDTEIWTIYPFSMLDQHFDAAIAALAATASYQRYAVVHRGEVVGMTNYIAADPANRSVEIGGTYIQPSVRGPDGINRQMKRLLINHAFACGYERIEFRVDARNLRSRAAVLKLGAKHEGVLCRNRITWTGHVRDTYVFGLLKVEWAG
jgi:RimJ/RimL family protein N-acetyltransferase